MCGACFGSSRQSANGKSITLYFYFAILTEGRKQMYGFTLLHLIIERLSSHGIRLMKKLVCG